MGKKIGIIGLGNIGGIFAKRISEQENSFISKIYGYDINRAKFEKCQKEAKILEVSSIKELTEKSDIVLIAVKPNVIGEVLHEVDRGFDTDKILVSVAAGVPISFFEKIIGTENKIVRTMPNTPAMIGEGITGVCCNSNVSGEDLEMIKSIFEMVGRVEFLEEKYFDIITSLTGSGPAYVFMFIEAMADAAVCCGLQRDQAYRLASHGIVGAARMLIESGKHPGELKDQVCSPAGTTIEAVKVLEKNTFRYAVFEAVVECAKKAAEIEKRLGG